jgi:hypothetical protein
MSTGDGKWCGFCFKNRETKQIVRSHVLRNSNTGKIECPILRAHRCEVCGATGDLAHTRSYCPHTQTEERRAQSTALSVQSTPRQSNGLERKSYFKIFMSYEPSILEWKLVHYIGHNTILLHQEFTLTLTPPHCRHICFFIHYPSIL